VLYLVCKSGESCLYNIYLFFSDFEGKEVWEVVKGMEGDKALGLDGFTMAFFQSYWGGGGGVW
jgi:hypothetical protein